MCKCVAACISAHAWLPYGCAHLSDFGSTHMEETLTATTGKLRLQCGVSRTTQTISGGTSCFSSLLQLLDRGGRSLEPMSAVLLAALSNETCSSLICTDRSVKIVFLLYFLGFVRQLC